MNTERTPRKADTMNQDTTTITIPTYALGTMLRALQTEAADSAEEAQQARSIGNGPGAVPFQNMADACEEAANTIREAIRASL